MISWIMHNVDWLLSMICWSTDWYLNELFIIINILLFYHMKQIESMLLWVCTVIHNVCLFFVLTTLWCHLWSITEQKHEIMESIFWSANLHPMLTLAIISILTPTHIRWGRSALQTDCRRPLSIGRISC